VRGYNFSPQKTSWSQNVPLGLRLDIVLRTTQTLESKHTQNFDVSSLYRTGSLKMTAKRLGSSFPLISTLRPSDIYCQ